MTTAFVDFMKSGGIVSTASMIGCTWDLSGTTAMGHSAATMTLCLVVVVVTRVVNLSMMALTATTWLLLLLPVSVSMV